MFDEVGSSSARRFESHVGVVQFPSKTELSRSQRNFLDVAVRMAETSEAEFKHGAVVVRGGRVLALGVNKWKNRDMPPTTSTEYNPHLTVHAEVDALSRVKNARGATIYVARVSKHGEERFSRPCPRCEKVLIAAGVKRVVYTVG